MLIVGAEETAERFTASLVAPNLRPTDLDRAYAAGFFDGEGCVYMARVRPQSSANRPGFQLQTIVTNTNREPLEWLWQRWRGGVYDMADHGSRARRGWQWRLQGFRQAGSFLRDLAEFSVEKRELIDIALRFADLQAAHHHKYGPKPMPEEVYQQQVALWLEHRAIMVKRGGPGRRRWSPTAWHVEFESRDS